MIKAGVVAAGECVMQGMGDVVSEHVHLFFVSSTTRPRERFWVDDFKGVTQSRPPDECKKSKHILGLEESVVRAKLDDDVCAGVTPSPGRSSRASTSIHARQVACDSSGTFWRRSFEMMQILILDAQ